MEMKTKLTSIKVAHSTAAQIKRWSDGGINVTTAVIACIRYGLSVADENPLTLLCQRDRLVQIGVRIPVDLLDQVDDLAEKRSESRSETVEALIQNTISDSIHGVSAPLSVFLPMARKRGI